MTTPTAVPTTVPTLRTATRADLAAVERLLVAADLPTAGVAAILADRPGDFIVADDPELPGELAAVAGLEVCGDSTLLRSVAVRPAWRRHGLGQALVRPLPPRAADCPHRGAPGEPPRPSPF